LRSKLLIPALLVPILAVGALYTGALSAATAKVPFLARAQAVVETVVDDAIEQVNDTVQDIVEEVQEIADDQPSDPEPTPEPVVDEPVTDTPVEEPDEPIIEDPVPEPRPDRPGYIAGTHHGVAILGTSRATSSTHPGWVDITLSMALASFASDPAADAQITLGAEGTQGCLASSGNQECFSIEWGTEEQFRAILRPQAGPSTWPASKAQPWVVTFEVPANAERASLAFVGNRVTLNLTGDAPAEPVTFIAPISQQPATGEAAPVWTHGYFMGDRHGISINRVSRTPNPAQPLWSEVKVEISVMANYSAPDFDLPIVLEASDRSLCFTSDSFADCLGVQWGELDQFTAALRSSRGSGAIAWPRTKAWPTSFSFTVPTSIEEATLHLGPHAIHLELQGEHGPAPAWDYALHYSPLNGMTLHDVDSQSIDLIAVERNSSIGAVLLVFEAVNRSEHLDFDLRVWFKGARVSDTGTVFEGVSTPNDGWQPVVLQQQGPTLAPGQSEEILLVLPRVEGPGFAAIPHSSNPPTGMLLKLAADNNVALTVEPVAEVARFQPFYVTFDVLAGETSSAFFFPDLAATNISVTPERPTLGELATVSFTIENVGPRNALATTLDFMVDGVKAAAVDVPSVPAGGSIVVPPPGWPLARRPSSRPSSTPPTPSPKRPTTTTAAPPRSPVPSPPTSPCPTSPWA
jgi:hypothetical protein